MIDVIPALNPFEALQRLGLLPQSGIRRQLYLAAVRELDLTIIDYQTIRDVLEMARAGEDPALEAALMALFVARNEGSLCVRADAESLARRLPPFRERDELVARFLANMQDGAYDEALLGREETSFRPLMLHNGHLYFQRYLHDESVLQVNLHAWLTGGQITPDPAAVQRAITSVLAAPPTSPQGTPIALNAEQQLALALALLQAFTVITGGPGTGKTAIIVAILRCLVRLGVPVQRIALTAPTGRAAQRMSESLRGQLAALPARTAEEERLSELAGQTIHRLLGYSPSRNTFAYGADNPLAVDVVIVDEVSMIDVMMMARLLEAVPNGAKLILLGDAQQLPSVEAGTVLADLVPAERQPAYSREMIRAVSAVLPSAPPLTPTPPEAAPPLTDHVVRLLQSHRSGPGIMAVASRINAFTDDLENELLSLLTDEKASCRWEDAAGETAARWWERLDVWAEEHYGVAYRQAVQQYRASESLTTVSCDAKLSAILRSLTRGKILTAIHEGRYGCDGINDYLADTVCHRLDPGNSGRYFAGAPLMITRNDYTLDLFNGDTGVVLRDTAGGYHAAFPRGEEAVLIPLDSLPEHTLAFAITVHKSQGSEYDHVLLALPASESTTARRLLTREIIYTALTRACQTAVIHTTREALLHACRTRVQRDSGLSLW